MSEFTPSDPYGMGEPGNAPPDHLIEEANAASDLRATVRAVNDNALAWHAGEEGKARALAVIAIWTSEALAGRVHRDVALIAADRKSDG